VSSIITRGYGKRNLIVTSGYGGLLKEVEEIVKEVITRYYPIDYKPFRKSIPVYGDVVQPFRKEINLFGDLITKFEKLIPVSGKKDLSQILSILLEKEEGLEDEGERNLRIEALQDSISKRDERISRLNRKLIVDAQKIHRAAELFEMLKETEKAKDFKRREMIIAEFYKLLRNEKEKHNKKK
jgi:hypothetical protein